MPSPDMSPEMSPEMSTTRSGAVNQRTSTRLAWFVDKELRELFSSRATLLLALAIGPLVGHAFITAVQAYAEVSGIAGGPAALAQGISPLDGLLVPTFGAYSLVATLLLPFVVIRLVSAEKESGALGLLLQGPTSLPVMIMLKALVLIFAWTLALVPGLVALLLWRSYGGHLHGPEVLVVVAGHILRGLVVIAIAFAAAAITDSAASAAVLALAATLGTWALDFVAQVQGGVAQQLARFTPESTLRVFEQGELSASIVVVALAVCTTLVAIATIALHPGRTVRGRVARSMIALGIGVLAIVAGSQLRRSTDVSEDRRNSFAPEDERALASLNGPIVVTAHLAPEDPRLTDLQRGVLHKLERITDVRVTTTARTGTGLFEKPAEGYGEVWYEWNGRRRMTRSTTVPIVLETLYELTGLQPPAVRADDPYAGYPLAARPHGAAVVFYVIWPVTILALAFIGFRRRA